MADAQKSSQAAPPFCRTWFARSEWEPENPTEVLAESYPLAICRWAILLEQRSGSGLEQPPNIVASRSSGAVQISLSALGIDGWIAGMQAALRTALLLSMIAFLSVGRSSNHLLAAEPAAKTNLYDPSADGNEQIAAALKAAKAGHKRIILKFGANW